MLNKGKLPFNPIAAADENALYFQSMLKRDLLLIFMHSWCKTNDVNCSSSLTPPEYLRTSNYDSLYGNMLLI
jgi:hypothetical protein